jgi:predicted alpha/beta-fold hydrolase
MQDINTVSFSSAPWCFNGHAHTVLCSLLFDSPKLNSKRISIDTPDDDFLELDINEGKENSPIVLLFHGLEGNSRRYYITRLAKSFLNEGYSTIAVNFRSCSGNINRKRRFYHSGETRDIDTVIRWAADTFPQRPIYAVGFSLGASALLNYLRENGTHHPVCAIAAVSTPFDLKKGSLNLNKGFNKIYTRYFLDSLVQKLDQKRKVYPDLPNFTGSTLYEFDDQVTGPVHGFTGADHYYESCSSAFFMNQIKTRTLVVHSMQDPLCPFQWTPVNEIKGNPAIKTAFTKRGGHVGFWSLPPGWINHTITSYFKTI